MYLARLCCWLVHLANCRTFVSVANCRTFVSVANCRTCAPVAGLFAEGKGKIFNDFLEGELLARSLGHFGWDRSGTNNSCLARGYWCPYQITVDNPCMHAHHLQDRCFRPIPGVPSARRKSSFATLCLQYRRRRGRLQGYFPIERAVATAEIARDFAKGSGPVFENG